MQNYKLIFLALLLVAMPCLAQDGFVSGPHATLQTDGSQADGSVNLLTSNAGPITFSTNNTKRGEVTSSGWFSWVASFLANNAWLKARNAANSADISVLKVDGSDETILNADTGDAIILSVATTPVAQLNASGFYVAPFAGDATFIADTAPRLAVTNVTPASGTPTPTANSLKIGYNVIISGSANHSVVLPTPVSDGLGQQLYVANASGQNIRIFPGDADDQINAGGTGKFTLISDKQEFRCHSVGAAAWRCHMLSAIPTPA